MVTYHSSNESYDLPISRIDGQSLSLLRTPTKKSIPTPNANLVSPVADRYIPNRAELETSLIASSLRSTEKRRNDIVQRAYEKHQNLILGKTSDRAILNNSPPSSPIATVDQMTFRQAMGAILHNRPLEQFYEEPHQGSLRMNSVKKNTAATQGGLLSVIHPNLKSEIQKAQERFNGASQLAYSSLSSLEADIDENLSGISSQIRHDSGPKRFLDFGRGLCEPRTVKPQIDPFQHNHHEVIQRAVTINSNENFRADRIVKTFSKRKIPDKPTKVLDAPDIVDDYYLNLISWSKDNILAVAMGPSVYVWNAANGEIGHIVTLRGINDYVSSVSWSIIPGCTRYLAIGTHSNTIQLWDTEAKRCVRKLSGHTNRVSSMTWNGSKKLLTSGGRDSQILQHDVRCSTHIVAKYKGHRQEVCGLKWNEDGLQLASGGNENYLCIWDAATCSGGHSHREARLEGSETVQPRLLLMQHKAAVKALDWCPFNRGLLASGGGSADRTIKFWNTTSGSLLQSIDTGSQVCSLIWSRHQKEICSSHGFSENQLILWKYPTMMRIQEFKSHTARVLNMEMSPDGRSVVSVGADETLRFWDIFGPPPQSRRRENFLLGDFQCPGVQTIR
jgi:cell division cycle 20, cofactor of APC complex